MGYLINMCQGIQKIKPPREPAPLYLPTESTTLEDWLSFCTESLRPAVELQSTPLVCTPSSLPFILSTDVQKHSHADTHHILAHGQRSNTLLLQRVCGRSYV